MNTGAGEPHRHAAVRHRRGAGRGDRQQRAHQRVRTVGVQISAAAASPGPSTPAQPDSAAVREQRHARRSAACNARASYAGDLQIGTGGISTLLAALSPSAYSTASLTVGGTLEVLSGGTAFFSGALGASAVTIDLGGALVGRRHRHGRGRRRDRQQRHDRGDGRSHAGAAAAHARQRRRGTGTLLIDAGATLIAERHGRRPGHPVRAQQQRPARQRSPTRPARWCSAAPQSISAARSAASPLPTGWSWTASRRSPARLADLHSRLDAQHPDCEPAAALTFNLSGTNLDPAGLTRHFLEQPDRRQLRRAAGGASRRASPCPARSEGAAGRGRAGAGHRPQHAASAHRARPTLSVTVALDAVGGTLSAGDNLGNTTSPATTAPRSRSPARSARSSAACRRSPTRRRPPPADSITLTVTDYAGTSAPMRRSRSTQCHASFRSIGACWPRAASARAATGSAIASIRRHRAAATSPRSDPGTYTVSGDGAVGQLVVNGTTTLTGQVRGPGNRRRRRWSSTAAAR